MAMASDLDTSPKRCSAQESKVPRPSNVLGCEASRKNEKEREEAERACGCVSLPGSGHCSVSSTPRKTTSVQEPVRPVHTPDSTVESAESPKIGGSEASLAVSAPSS